MTGYASVPTAIAAILILSLSSPNWADPPLFGRPTADYYDAVGEDIRVQMSAVPTDVRVEQELTLTIKVIGSENPERIRRPDLRLLDDFKNRFYVDDLDDGPAPAAADRTFRYKLRPRNESVTEIPPLLFRYWQPRLKYFAATSPEVAIPLAVQARESSDATATPLAGPGFLFELSESSDIFAPLPEPSSVGDYLPFVLLFGPLVYCFAWYLAWRWRNPGAAQLAQFRRLHAVRAALDELRAVYHKPDHAVAGRTAAVVRGYLRERWGLPVSATTPSEIEIGLSKFALPLGLVKQAATIFRACDAAQFGTRGQTSSTLPMEAERLIQAFEKRARDLEKTPPHGRRGAIAWIGIIATMFLIASRSIAGYDDPEQIPGLVQSAKRAFLTAVAARDHDEKARPLFRDAAEKFFKIRTLGLSRDWSLRNEANARVLAGDLPGAILVYRQGLRHYPEDETLQRGLDYARSQVQYATPEDKVKLSPPADRFARFKPPLRHWGLLVAFAFASAGWIGLTRWLMVRNRWYLVLGLIALGIACALTATRILEERHRLNEFAVSIASPLKPVTLRLGDGPSFLPARDLPLPPGAEIRVIQRRGGWIQVELADGTLGWLPRQSVAILMGSDSPSNGI